MVLVVLLVVLLAVPARAAAQSGTVPITAEPSHHLALTNAQVRVFDVTAAPHASTLVHQHDHDYLFVTLGDADITSTRAEGTVSRLVLKDGQVEYAPGHFAHAVANNTDRPFHNITVELLQPATGVVPCRTDCARRLPCAGAPHCGSATRLYTADQWTVDAVELRPGDRWQSPPQSAPRLVVLASDADLALTGDFASTETRHRTAGNLIWMPGVRGARARSRAALAKGSPMPGITNIGSQPVRLIVLDWATNR